MEEKIDKGSPAETLEFLESMSDGTEHKKFFRGLTKKEREDGKSNFTRISFEIADLEDQKKEVISEFKVQIDPLKAEIKELSSELRTGFKQMEGKLFRFVDREKGKTYFYSETGEKIESQTRPCTAAELAQTNLINQIRESQEV